MPAGVLADQARGRRRDDDEVGPPAEAGVRDRVVGSSNSAVRAGSEASAEKVASPTKRSAPLRQHRRDVRAGVDEPAADLDRLVGGDPAA